MNEAERPRQLSLDGEFTPASQVEEPQRREVQPAKSSEDPTTLRSAYGILPVISAEPATVIVDADSHVVEHHVGWLAACVEHRAIQVLRRDYADPERHEAAVREYESATIFAAHAKELVEQAVAAGHEAKLPVREIARHLRKSPSHITRIIQRMELRREHHDLAERLTDSHLEAVATCDRDTQRQLLEQAVADSLSVHELEQSVRDNRIAFRRIVGTDQRYLEVLDNTGLSRLVPNWKDQAREWVAWFKDATRAAEQCSPSLPRGNKRHGRAA
jgi:hypothetical protein